MGPTASGKTALACKLRSHLPCDIISVDSAMIYRDMDIGTAKLSRSMLAEHPHRLIDILNPDKRYSVADFCQDVQREMDDIFAKGRIPLLVGGTMMYFKALQEGLATFPAICPMVQKKLKRRFEQKEPLHNELMRLDPITAQQIHPNDTQRLQRALEVCLSSQKPFSSFIKEQQIKSPSFNSIQVALLPEDRAKLHQAIAKRFDQMLLDGFLDEVEALSSRYVLDDKMPSMRCVGYRQARAYLAGALSYEEMYQKSLQSTRQLAKRQLTWLRNWKRVDVFDSDDSQLAPKILAKLPFMR